MVKSPLQNSIYFFHLNNTTSQYYLLRIRYSLLACQKLQLLLHFLSLWMALVSLTWLMFRGACDRLMMVRAMSTTWLRFRWASLWTRTILVESGSMNVQRLGHIFGNFLDVWWSRLIITISCSRWCRWRGGENIMCVRIRLGGCIGIIELPAFLWSRLNVSGRGAISSRGIVVIGVVLSLFSTGFLFNDCLPVLVVS